MFNGLFHFNWVVAAAAGISIILAAVYTLRMIEKVLYGSPANSDLPIADLSPNITWALVVLVALVLIGGIYPQPLIDLTKDTVEALTLKK
jgi:NADH-quinone oxidoreductase subunit M